MSGFTKIDRDTMSDFIRRVAETLKVKQSQVMPFTDSQDVITAFLNFIGRSTDRLIVGGHVAPEIEIAADRAGMRVQEGVGFSPFVGHVDDVLSAISSSSDIVYLANPNQVTGSSFSLRDLDKIADRVSDGKLIVDESYFDFYGISAIPLLEKYTHVVILRSLTTGFGLDSDMSGFMIGSQGLISGFKDIFDWRRYSKTQHRIQTTILTSHDARNQRVNSIHDESLRTANALTKQGVQNRLTSADFILLRVADPARVGNFLAKYGVAVTNLDGYPELKQYMRYRVQSPLSNDNLLAAFKRMPKDYYHLDNIDRRAVLLRRPADDDEIVQNVDLEEVGGVDLTRVVENSNRLRGQAKEELRSRLERQLKELREKSETVDV